MQKEFKDGYEAAWQDNNKNPHKPYSPAWYFWRNGNRTGYIEIRCNINKKEL